MQNNKDQCRACELDRNEFGDHNGCYFYPKLYIQCPNILSSIYAQKRLHEQFGFEILGKEPHFSSRFVVVGPPKGEEYENDKPLIVSGGDADENKNWIDLLDALNLITLTEHMKSSNPPTK